MPTIKSMDDFMRKYQPRQHLRYLEEAKLESIKVCPRCGSLNVVWNEHKTFGYFLCYGCDWSSMTPGEIGTAMAKESSRKLKLKLGV